VVVAPRPLPPTVKFTSPGDNVWKRGNPFRKVSADVNVNTLTPTVIVTVAEPAETVTETVVNADQVVTHANTKTTVTNVVVDADTVGEDGGVWQKVMNPKKTITKEVSHRGKKVKVRGRFTSNGEFKETKRKYTPKKQHDETK